MYGFGLSTLLLPAEGLSQAGVVGYPGGVRDRQATDPNIEQQMSDSDFTDALYGTWTDEGTLLSAETPCFEIAHQQVDVFGVDQDGVTAAGIYYDYTERVQSLSFASSEWQSAIDEVVLCLVESGFRDAGSTIASAEEERVSDSIEFSLSELTDPILLEVMSSQTGTVRDLESLIDLQTYELQLAQSAWSCGYFDLPSRNREIGQAFEAEVEEDMAGDLIWLAEHVSSRSPSE